MKGAWKPYPKGTSFEYKQRNRTPMVKNKPDCHCNDNHILDLLPSYVSRSPYPAISDSGHWWVNMKGNYIHTGGSRMVLSE